MDILSKAQMQAIGRWYSLFTPGGGGHGNVMNELEYDGKEMWYNGLTKVPRDAVVDEIYPPRRWVRSTSSDYVRPEDLEALSTPSATSPLTSY